MKRKDALKSYKKIMRRLAPFLPPKKKLRPPKKSKWVAVLPGEIILDPI